MQVVSWDQWQTLLAVFRGGTYKAAALSLQVNATTIGRRIKLLEQQLGYQLFFRQEGLFYPTHQCEALISHVETASEILRAAEQDSATSESGGVWRDLRMTAPPFLIKNVFAPAVPDLVKVHRIRIELMGTGSNVSLSRREAGIAIRIEDRRPSSNVEISQVDAERIGMIAYAVYCGTDVDPEGLPWAGLMEDNLRTTGSDVMTRLAGDKGFQLRAYHFDALPEAAAAGAAPTMLPCVIGGGDARLRPVGNIVLEQPLWMLSHQQDRDVHHLNGTRSWIVAAINERLCSNTTKLPELSPPTHNVSPSSLAT